MENETGHSIGNSTFYTNSTQKKSSGILMEPNPTTTPSTNTNLSVIQPLDSMESRRERLKQEKNNMSK